MTATVAIAVEASSRRSKSLARRRLRESQAKLRAITRRRGITPVPLTGDNRRTAEAVAREVGIDEVFAQVAPADKAARIRALQETGARVAMVGDSINDAPALRQAHVGIAIGAGTDIAIESSDVVLIGERLSAVPEAITIGGRSYRKTAQNLWLAFFFNGVGVPTAATGVLHPSWAMAAMAASVTLVLANFFGGRLLQPRRAQLERPAGKPAPAAPERVQPAEPDRGITLTVPDMHCAGRLETFRANPALEDGVGEISGDLKTKQVHIAYRAEVTTPGDIETAVSRLGYRVRDAHHEAA